MFNTIYQTTADNKLSEFGFKFLHRILVTSNLRRQLDLLVLLIKKYIYSCKSGEINPECSKFINKLKI